MLAMRKSSSNAVPQSSVTRTFIKYGAHRIGIVLVIATMLLLTGFYWYDAERKTNDNIQKVAVERSRKLLLSKEVSGISKANYLLVEERLMKGSLMSYLKGIRNKKEQLDLTLAAYRLLLYADKFTKMPIKTELINLLVDGFDGYKVTENDRSRSAWKLEQQNQFLFLLVFDEYYNPSTRLIDSVIPAIASSQFK